MQPLRIDPDGDQALFDLLDSFGGVGISFQEMTLSGQSAGHKDAVDAPFEGPQNINLVQLAGTGETDHFDAG
jgi:hypothetical protein